MLSDREIVDLCLQSDNIISGDPKGRGLVKLSGELIAKCGVTASEAANQQYVYDHSSQSDLRVPRIHRHFNLDGKGYLIMEFIDGISLEDRSLHDEEITSRLADAVRSLFAHMVADFPGPRDRGVPQGHLFSEDGALVQLDSISALNKWLNNRYNINPRACTTNASFSFDLNDCGFCHLDLARRNVILCPDGSFALLDWEHAGFYPKVFELYCLHFNSQFDFDFSRKMISDLFPAISEEQQDHLNMLNRVYQNNQKFSW